MRWLMRLRQVRERDGGAVTVIVAIMFPVVFLGLAAFAIDIGGNYVQRAQTQNGADAGAIAVARSCALSSGCDLTAATGYAGTANSNGSRNIVNQVNGVPCGRTPADAPVALQPCTADAYAKTCPAAPATGSYVNVVNNTVKDDGSTTLVPTILSQAVGGQGHTVGACAQAVWGTPIISGDILALTFAECAYNTDVPIKADGTRDYAPSPPTVPPASYERELDLHNPADATDPTCVSGPNVGPLPGGFGWTVPNLNSACQATFVANGWYTSDPGKGTQTGSQCTDKGNNAGVIPLDRIA